MMITQLQLKNFTVFNDLNIEFSPKINIIIGENGTGKTHLLKAAYALNAGRGLLRNESEINDVDMSNTLTEKLVKVFMPLENKLGKLRRQGTDQSDYAHLHAEFFGDTKVGLNFHANSKTIAFQAKSAYQKELPAPVYIPTKEVLSFMEGFASLYSRYALSFDQTYYDICLSLDLPFARPEHISEKSKWAIKEIEKTIGGKFIFHGGGRVTFKTSDGEYSANTMAEGFRKLGILLRLIETGVIQPGINGALFWDEPESNINPKLMRLLVEILLELSRNGQQIILATHDYVLLKWFDLLMKKNKGDHVRFHSLYKDPSTNMIKIASTDDYLTISPNPIDDAFGILINQEIENDMGDLGK
jgi:predicted ATPase